jgi:hypothetical protein
MPFDTLTAQAIQIAVAAVPQAQAGGGRMGQAASAVAGASAMAGTLNPETVKAAAAATSAAVQGITGALQAHMKDLIHEMQATGMASASAGASPEAQLTALEARVHRLERHLRRLAHALAGRPHH